MSTTPVIAPQDQIAALLGDTPVSVAYVGPRTDSVGWPHDEWSVTIGDYRTTYRTGVGHRIWDKPHSQRRVLPRGTTPHKYTAHELGSPRTLHRESMERAHLKPVEPHIGEVFACLVRDGEAINQSFIDWCGDYGLNPDSIKDRALYDECCAVGQHMRAAPYRAALQSILELASEL